MRIVGFVGLFIADASRISRHESNVTLEEKMVSKSRQLAEVFEESWGSYPKAGQQVTVDYRDSAAFKKTPGVMCTADDRQLLFQYGYKGRNDKKQGRNFAQEMNDCGRAGYTFWVGFSYKDFKKCVRKTAFGTLTDKCQKCLSIGPSYGAQNCKGACVSNACSKDCIDCNAASGYYINQCSGGGTPTTFCPKNKVTNVPKKCRTMEGIFDADGAVKPIPADCKSGNE